MLSSVAFLGTQDAAEEPEYHGTGFFVQLMHEEPWKATVGLRYLVTVRHVVAGDPKRPGSGLRHARAPFAQYRNLMGDTSAVALSGLRWHYPDDESVDLAVCYLPVNSPRDLALAEDMLLKDDEFSEFGFGIGDETVSVSLFGFKGKARSPVPILRVGNIAMVPPHKVQSEFGEVEGYLIESRSLSGFSGAPVFVRESVRLADVAGPSGERTRPFATGNIRLLGVMHGHWELEGTERGLNTGIAIVVPSHKIIDLFASPAFREAMEGHAQDRRARLRQAARGSE